MMIKPNQKLDMTYHFFHLCAKAERGCEGFGPCSRSTRASEIVKEGKDIRHFSLRERST
jgi:hypothetical protein